MMNLQEVEFMVMFHSRLGGKPGFKKRVFRINSGIKSGFFGRFSII
jgi:hypothetical protein